MFFEKFMSLKIRKTLKPIIGYLFVGGSAAIVDWVLFACLIYIYNISYIVAAIISFGIATLVNYFIGIKTIFTSGAKFNKKSEVSLVLFVSGIGLMFNLLFLKLLSEIFLINIMISKIVATILTFAWNYSSRMFFIFKKS
jgi:putative flippase GtrA